MALENRRAPTAFSTAEIDAFRTHGYARLGEAFPRGLALAMQDEIWDEIACNYGIRRDDRGTWKTLPRSPSRAKHSPLNEKLATARFTGAISDLLGYDDWQRPATWGGFNVHFPKQPNMDWFLPEEIWHWDGSATSRGLLIFSFYSDVRAGGGGTLIVDGSHRLVQDFYASLSPEELARKHKFHRKAFTRWDPWLEGLTGQSSAPVKDRVEAYMDRTTDVRGLPCRVVELTGQPGDAVFCDLGLVHAVAPNVSEVPRFVRVKFLFVD